MLSASFIAYAPDYIKKVNDFSSDVSTAALDLGTKIMLPGSDSEGKDSVDLIRDSLFSIQVEQPWLLLQFGDSNKEEIGTERVESLVSVSPDDEDGATREEIVKTEIEDNDNTNLTIPQVINRLGMVFFLLFFNLGITIFVFLLTGIMIFSQILFIIFSMFLPISFLLSMIPGYESMTKQAIVRVFNTIMTRAGITLIVTVAFSISSMFYNISTDYPFFMIAFLQIVCFAGIYMKLGDLMNMFSLNASDSQGVARRIFHRPYMFMRHRARRMERRMTRAASLGVAAGTGAMACGIAGKQQAQANKQRSRNNVSNGSFKDVPRKAGAVVGAVMDTKNKMKDKAGAVRENIKDMPTQASYAVYSASRQAKESVSDFKRGIVQEREHRQSGREEKREQHRQSIADKRMALQKMQEQSGVHKTHERPAAVSKEDLSRNGSKVQEIKRPVTSEKSNTPVIKRQQKVNVEHIEKARPLSSYEKNHQNDGANRRSIKSQSVQTVQKSQVHKETDRKVISKKGQKKK